MLSIFESIIDDKQKHYSEYVFTNPTSNNPTLKPEVREKILKDVGLLRKRIEIKEFFIKGSILTKRYTKNSDIDIYIQIDSDLPENTIFKLLKNDWEKIDDTRLDGNPHTFQYYISKNPYNFKETDAAYDVKTNNLIKRESTKDIDIDNYLKAYHKYVSKFADFTEEIRRDVIDYEILKDISPENLSKLNKKLKVKLKEIEIDLNNYLETYQELKEFRNKVFSKNMTPSEMKLYGSKTGMPGNVIFKFIERYHYLDLAKKIKKIIGDDGQLSKKEYKQLNNILKKRLTTESNTNFKQVMAGKIKGRKDLQHKAKHRQQSNSAGLLGHGERKSANILPDYQRSDPNKLERKISASKKQSGVIKVKQGSPEAIRLAKKYRIANPKGKKTVGGNQHNAGLTIIFENYQDTLFPLYFDQIKHRTYSSLSEDLIDKLESDGWFTEYADNVPSDYGVIELITPEIHKKSLKNKNKDYIKVYKQFSNCLRKQFPGYIDILDLETGKVYIIKHFNH